MKKLYRWLPALLLAMPTILLVCAKSPTNPFGGIAIDTTSKTTNLPSITLNASKFDLNADGRDHTLVIAKALDADRKPINRGQILWTLSSRNFTGGSGSIESASSFTNANGEATTLYLAPALDFVPVGAIAIVTGTLNVPNNPQGSPRASVTFILRPKGTGPTTGTGVTGEPVAPIVTSVTPSTIKVDANPAVTVIIKGENFSATSEVLIVTSDGLFTAPAQFLSASQVRFAPPLGLKAGNATLFVTGPGNQLSQGFPVSLTTGVTIGTTPSVPGITQLLPTQGPVGTGAGTPTRIVLLGTGFSVANCPSAGNITFINEFVGLRKICPVSGETATSQRLVVDAPTVGLSQSGPVNVFVTNDDGTISNALIFTYTAGITNAPSLNALSPATGPTTGETKVIVTGRNFLDTDSVVIAGPQIFSPTGDVCADPDPAKQFCSGKTLCCNNQCVLNAARGACTINGTPVAVPFKHRGSGQIEVVMPNVGTSAAGLADVLVRTETNDASNIVKFTYTAPAAQLPPVTDALTFTFTGRSVTAFTFVDGSWPIIITGRNFRKCSSLIFANLSPDAGIIELLPSPDVSDCAIRRGSTSSESPRERLFRLLPPDGETINCGQRPDLVPLQETAAPECSPPITNTPSCAVGTYVHGLICDPNRNIPPTQFPRGYNLTAAQMIPAGPAPLDQFDVTSGASFTWINESEIRLFYPPARTVSCQGSHDINVYVSNDPGRGLSGDQLSNPIKVNFVNPEPCLIVTPLPAPVISFVSPSSGTCKGGISITIGGANFAQSAPPVVDIGGQNAPVTSFTNNSIIVTVPKAPPDRKSVV